MVDTKELHRLYETKGRPTIDLRLFNVQRAGLRYPDGTEIHVTPEDPCFAFVVRLAQVRT